MLPKLLDNRTPQTQLVAALQELLPSAQSAHFASGYFFLSGFEQVAGHLDGLEKLRLLIGTQSNRQTVEQIAEGYARREMAREETRRAQFQTPEQKAEKSEGAREDLAREIESLPQTEGGEKVLVQLGAMIESGRLEIRVFTKARLHAKAYIFDFKNPNPTSKGVSIVGSSNFTLSGVSDNTELNVFVHDQNGEHDAMLAWFESLWQDAQPFDAALMDELQQSWALALPTPWQIYLKILVALVGERLDGGALPDVDAATKIEGLLTDFQRDAVLLAERTLEKWGGCFVADVVGLGKSFIGAAIVKRAQQFHRARPLIICPRPLLEMWESYNETFELDAKIVAMSQLLEDGGADLSQYENRDFVLIDESHSFRNPNTQRYRELDEFLESGAKKVCLLSATPLNSSAWDVYHQLKLFHREEKTALAIDPPELKPFFKKIETGQAKLTALLPQILIRRRRQDVLRLYGFAGDSNLALKSLSEGEVAPYLKFQKPAYVLVGGNKQGFPSRTLQTWRYSIEDTYAGLYETIRRTLGEAPKRLTDGSFEKPKKHELSYARYGLLNYLPASKRKLAKFENLSKAGFGLRGLMRILLFKRFESSVCAFQKTLERMIAGQKMFLRVLQEKQIVAAGQDAQSILRLAREGNEDALFERLNQLEKGYDAADFSVGDLAGDLRKDIALLEGLLALVKPIEAAQDAKLQTFLAQLNGPLRGRKVLIFTQYLDTANYLFSHVKAHDSAVVASGDADKSVIVARFAPRANAAVWKKHRSAGELRVLVATDVLAEGLNLQDGDIIVNYDLHWNPVRLIQRFGRIDRIGSTHAEIYGYNFLPETNLEKNLGIQAVLEARIAEIHRTLGEDSAILHPDETLSEDAMRAIYTGEAAGENQTGDLFEDAGERDELALLTEAEVLLRRLREAEPETWREILNLRGGVRSAKVGVGVAGNKIVVCAANDWVALYLSDGSGKILSRDLATILPILESARELPAPERIPAGHGEAVNRVLNECIQEWKLRQAHRDQTRRISSAQKWVSERLNEFFRLSDSANVRSQLPLVEKALLAGDLPRAARRELESAAKKKLAGEELWREAARIFLRYELGNRPAPVVKKQEEWPRVVCSLALE